jgi:hypothetical protein
MCNRIDTQVADCLITRITLYEIFEAREHWIPEAREYWIPELREYWIPEARDYWIQYSLSSGIQYSLASGIQCSRASNISYKVIRVIKQSATCVSIRLHILKQQRISWNLILGTPDSMDRSLSSSEYYMYAQQSIWLYIYIYIYTFRLLWVSWKHIKPSAQIVNFQCLYSSLIYGFDVQQTIRIYINLGYSSWVGHISNNLHNCGFPILCILFVISILAPTPTTWCPKGIFDPWVRWDLGLDRIRSFRVVVAVLL